MPHITWAENRYCVDWHEDGSFFDVSLILACGFGREEKIKDPSLDTKGPCLFYQCYLGLMVMLVVIMSVVIMSVVNMSVVSRWL